jgi:hypothetical protein
MLMVVARALIGKGVQGANLSAEKAEEGGHDIGRKE